MDIYKPPFYKTLEIFSDVVGKSLRLEFVDQKTSTTDGWHVRLPLPEKPPYFVKTQRDLYTLEEHEIAHIVCKTDLNNKIRIRKEFPSIPDIAGSVFDILEDYRIENIWGQLYAGSKECFKKLRSRLPQDVSNPLQALFVTANGYPDVAYAKFPDFTKFVLEELRNLESAGPQATYVVAKRIVSKIKSDVEKQVRNKKQEQQKAELTQKEDSSSTIPVGLTGDGLTGSLGKVDKNPEKQEKKLPERDSLDGVQRSEKSNGSSGSVEGKKDEEQDSDEQSKDSAVPPKFDTLTEKEVEKEVLEQILSTGKGLENACCEASGECKTRSVNVENKSDEELLLESEKFAEELIDDVVRKLHVEEQKNPPEDRGIIGTVVKKDVFGEVGNAESDLSTVMSLRRVFAKVKGRERLLESEEGSLIDIDNYIQKKAGQSSVPIFQEEATGLGLNIAIVLDVSGSMTRSIKQAKDMLATIYDSVVGIPNVEIKIFAYAGNKENSYSTPVVEVSRERLETLYPQASWTYTHTHVAVQYVANYLQGKGGKRLLVLITDGLPVSKNIELSRMQWLTSLAVANARKKAIAVYTIFVESLISGNILGVNTEDRLTYMFGKSNTWTKVADFESAGKVLTNVVARKIVGVLYAR